MERMRRLPPAPALAALALSFLSLVPPGPHAALAGEEPLFDRDLDVHPPHMATDPSVRWDYDIAYVRARRAGDEVHKRFYTDIAAPVFLEPGADLMLLHPDGSEELLVEGGDGAVTDPMVSLDGEWIYYTLIHTLEGANQWQPPVRGADIYKVHARTREVRRLTRQELSPNTGAADWSPDVVTPGAPRDASRTHLSYGVLNFGPCPLPGGRIAFTSNRNAFRPPRGYPTIALQLFVMDEDGANLEQIGHLNLAGALHPVVLADGRIIFSSLESQGIRSDILWGIWSIHPDGTRWGPVVSAFDTGGAPNAFHFQTQLSDGSLVVEEYYNQNNSGFGAYIKLPAAPPAGYPAFAPAHAGDPRQKPLRFGRFDNGRGKWYHLPFLPAGAESLTPFALNGEGPADRSALRDEKSPWVGKFTHPSGAPDNHLLTVWSPGPVNHQYTFLPQLDGGIYLLKGGKPIDEPGQLLLIKNDPRYNESWPRAVVPYERIYGIAEPRSIPPLPNDGRLSPQLGEGSPFGLVGTSSLYKRESYPGGAVPPGAVTASYPGGNDPWRGLDAFTSHGNGMPLNWHNQGADAGLYSNGDIHAVRILVQEPTTDRNRGPRSGRLFHSHTLERLRILGEIPVRKLQGPGGEQPLDPDGNPDTSFLARIPADTSFTFQTIDRHGMVLNMAQTWHQLRPGEARTDCGGCHAHSQQPTHFEQTAAARPGYEVWDLVTRTPLVTSAERDESGVRWDAEGKAGLRFAKGPADVEYFRHVKPILERSCAACHTKRWEKPAGNLVLDADGDLVDVPQVGRFPGTYYRLALDEGAKFGHKPAGWDSWGYPQASRYVRKLQSRRSLLVWKIFGRRLDGFANDDHPSETEPGSGVLAWKGKALKLEEHRARMDVDFTGSAMPPPEAVEGRYEAPGGRTVRVEPLSDEDRRAIVRWIDLGCPIDLDFDPARPDRRGHGWMCDDNRPVVTVTWPRRGSNDVLHRVLVGMHDYGSGLDLETLSVTADFPLAGAAPGQDLASRLKPASPGVWELRLDPPVWALERGRLAVSVKDRQGNTGRVERTFSVRPRAALPERVHVFEDYETEIVWRWWLRGAPGGETVPPPSSASVANRRACRAGPTKDFDDLQGDPARDWKAVVFNPVPGPPVGDRTRLSFRYRLEGTDALRVQIYSLTNGYHRKLELRGLEQGAWRDAVVDMTLARRPDGSGGPLSRDERIDDIQLYVDPGADLWVDDILLYEAAAEGEREPFPRRVIFTGWFDTGKQGAEWPGGFEIVKHEPPRTWKAARSVRRDGSGPPWIRIGLRGERPLGGPVRLRFQCLLLGATSLVAELACSRTGERWEREVAGLPAGLWTLATADFATGSGEARADELRLHAPAGSELLVDDVLLYEPGGPERAF
ncbi:MAG: hypothetical protein HY721_10935 [Planctomycetes bacterium]|nr:hypothetical protein [Planctomycetota bacterium]